MKGEGLLHRPIPWSHCNSHPSSSPTFHRLSFQTRTSISLANRTKRVGPVISAMLDGGGDDRQQLTAGRERRKVRNEKRQSRANSSNWREEVEEKLTKKPKKRYASWKEELNLNLLALLGPQWWILRVSRTSGHVTAGFLARSLSLRFPDTEFKIYAPTAEVRSKLKNGSHSVKQKPLFPGCAFLWCALDKDLHDFIRDYAGVGGFVGATVGNSKRQINKPRPVSVEHMEAIFRQSKELREKSELALKNKQCGETAMDPENRNTGSHTQSGDGTGQSINTKPRRQPGKASKAHLGGLSTEQNVKTLALGTTVRVLSGNLAEFVGKLIKLDRKNGKATVQFTLFGKVTIADLDVNEIVAVTI